MTTEVTQTDDGQMYVVSVEMGGITKKSLCSSMHLVPDHEARLKRLINENSAAAFFERSKDISDG